MFSGVVPCCGAVHSRLETTPTSCRLTIISTLPLSQLDIGTSVAVNGCCLTVTSRSAANTFTHSPHLETTFTVDVGPETIARTRLGSLVVGERVHLEPSLRLGDAMAGHWLTGHIDTLCQVIESEPTPGEPGYWTLGLRIEPAHARWVIPQGSIAVAGISLTVAKREKNDDGSLNVFVMLIPHTVQHTLLSQLKPQDNVEIEFDHMVKTIVSTLEQVQKS